MLSVSDRISEGNNPALAISVHYMRVVAQELGARGKELDQLLDGTGISREHFINDDFKLSGAQQNIFSLNAMAFSGDDGLGLRVGRRFTPETHGPIGFLVCSSPNLEAALLNFKRYYSLLLSNVDLQVCSRNKKFVMTLEITQSFGDARLDRSAIECTVQSICAIVQAVLGQELVQAELKFSYPPPAYAARYKEHFRFPFSFSCDENSISIDEQVALTRNPIASQANYVLAQQQCNAMIDEIPASSRSLCERTRRVLLSKPPGTIDEAAAAESLFVSKRTLSRQLSSEGTSFRKLKEEILSDLASKYLIHTNDSVESIAVLLNYFDASNFRRAFKRWHTLTPEEYRRNFQGVSSHA